MSTQVITEGRWTYQIGGGQCVATDGRTGVTVTAVDIVDARKRTFAVERSSVRFTVVSGPGRAQCGHRRYTEGVGR